MNQERRKVGNKSGGQETRKFLFSCVPVFLIVLCGLFLSSCATTFHAPNNAKLEASTKRLSAAVTKATNTAERARIHVEAARKAADKEAISSASVLTQLDDLLKVLPPELKAKGDSLKAAVDQDQTDVGEIVVHVDGAQKEHGQLAKDLFEASAAKLQVEIDKQEYYEKADKLAAIATKDSKALAWYRRHFFLGWAIFISGIIACVVLALLKWGTKWGVKLGATAAKAGI